MSQRPELDILLNGEKKPDEAFMHEVLRPILKKQHFILVESLQAQKHVNKELLNGSDEGKKRRYLTELIKKNQPLKHQILGMIVGIMTTEERAYYWNNEKNLNKRIIGMAITRIHSHYSL